MTHYFYIDNELPFPDDMTWSDFKNGTNEEQLRYLARKRGVNIEDPQLREELQNELKSHIATYICFYNLYERLNEATNAVKDKKCKGCGCVYSWVPKPGTRARDYTKEAQEEEKQKKDRIIPKYEVAEPVKAKCKGWQNYLKGVVIKDNGDNTYVIDFENEKKKYVKEMEMIQVQPGKWSIKKKATVITNKEAFDELPYDFYLEDRSQNYHFNVKEDTRRTYQGGIDYEKPKCSCKSCKGFDEFSPSIKEESMRTFYDEGMLVVNSYPGSDEMPLGAIAEKPLDITVRMCKLLQGFFKNDQSLQRVQGPRDCTVGPPLRRMISAIRYLLKKTDSTKDYEKCDEKDDRRERSICENCRCGKISCMSSQFPCHSYLDGKEICHGTATQCKTCKNVYALCSFSHWIAYLRNYCNKGTKGDWKELLEKGNMTCTRCFLKNYKEHKIAHYNSYNSCPDKRLQKAMEKEKKKKKKNEWKRRCEKTKQDLEKARKHQWEHLDRHIKNRCLKIADAKINSFKFEGIPVTQTREQIAMARLEGNSSISYEEYYRQNIQPEEEENKRAEEKRKLLEDAKVNYIIDMPKWDTVPEKENYFIQNYPGDKYDTLAVHNFNTKNQRKWCDEREKLREQYKNEYRKYSARVLQKFLDDPLNITKEDVEIVKSYSKSIYGCDIDIERRGDKVFYELISKKRKRAEDSGIANEPKKAKNNACQKSSESTEKNYLDSVPRLNVSPEQNNVETISQLPPRETTDDDVASEVDDDEFNASGLTHEDDNFDEDPACGSHSWDNFMPV